MKSSDGNNVFDGTETSTQTAIVERIAPPDHSGPVLRAQQIAQLRPAKRIALPPEKALERQVKLGLRRPAIKFAARLVTGTMKALCDGIPLVHFHPYRPWQTPFSCDFFLGSTYDGNPNEKEHAHPGQEELFFVVEGVLRVDCSYGLDTAVYLLRHGDCLLVKRGVWHKIGWTKPGWAWVVKSPNNLPPSEMKIVRYTHESGNNF